MIIQKVRKFLFILTKMHLLSTLLHTGVAASVEHTQALKNISRENLLTIVDVGANRGQFALIARMLFPMAIIHSFEPLSEAAKIFHEIFASDSKTILYQYALGPLHVRMEIHVSKQDDSSSLLPISRLQDLIFPGTREKEIRTVEVRTLGEILSLQSIQQPALLKIDVQGYEIDVLKGCQTLLDSFTYIYVECSFVELYLGQPLAYEVISFLSDHGFAITGIYNLCYSKQGFPIQGDFLFQKISGL